MDHEPPCKDLEALSTLLMSRLDEMKEARKEQTDNMKELFNSRFDRVEESMNNIISRQNVTDDKQDDVDERLRSVEQTTTINSTRWSMSGTVFTVLCTLVGSVISGLAVHLLK